MSHAPRMSGLYPMSVALALAVSALAATPVSAQPISPPPPLQEDVSLTVVTVLPGNGPMAYRDTSAEVPGTPGEVRSAAAKRKSPVTAFALSLVVPGAGQAYNGQWGKAALMFGGTLASSTVYVLTVIADFRTGRDALLATGLAGMIGFPVWSMIDAPKAASRLNQANGFSLEVGPRVDLGFASAPTGSTTYGLATNVHPRVGLSLARVRF